MSEQLQEDLLIQILTLHKYHQLGHTKEQKQEVYLLLSKVTPLLEQMLVDLSLEPYPTT